MGCLSTAQTLFEKAINEKQLECLHRKVKHDVSPDTKQLRTNDELSNDSSEKQCESKNHTMLLFF